MTNYPEGTMDDDDCRFVEACRLGARLHWIHAELAGLEPDEQPAVLLEERAATESALVAILEDALPELASLAESAAIGLQQQALTCLKLAAETLGPLRMVAAAAEEWKALAGPGARVDYGTDLVDAARADIERVLVPLPVLELPGDGARAER